MFVRDVKPFDMAVYLDDGKTDLATVVTALPTKPSSEMVESLREKDKATIEAVTVAPTNNHHDETQALESANDSNQVQTSSSAAATSGLIRHTNI
jgi:hypothetical protein